MISVKKNQHNLSLWIRLSKFVVQIKKNIDSIPKTAMTVHVASTNHEMQWDSTKVIDSKSDDYQMG